MPPCECADKISSTASAEFSDSKVHNVVTQSTAERRATMEKSRVRAEGLEPSTQGLKGVQNSKQTLQDDGMLQQLRSTT